MKTENVRLNDSQTFRDNSLDDSLYSRQRYVLGDFAMSKLAKASVLISGLGGLGLEIAKNVILAGPSSVVLHDTKSVSAMDLSSHFYASETQGDANRAEVSGAKLAELNPYVKVSVVTTKIEEDLSYLKQFQCVVLTDCQLDWATKVSSYCHTNKIGFIMADVRGVFCWAFVDFGPAFDVFDNNGEENLECLVGSISQGNPGVVDCLEGNIHGFETGDYVTFREVQGMQELNGAVHQIKVISPKKFSIGDTSALSAFTTGGVVSQVKATTTISHKPLAESIHNPEFLPSDFSKMDSPDTLHVGMQALHEFTRRSKTLPRVWNNEDAEEVIKIAESIKQPSKPELNSKLIKSMSYTARGALGPLSAFMGGVVAQEVMKGLTGKFTPLHQWLYFDVVELLPEGPLSEETFGAAGLSSKRSEAQAICTGRDVSKTLEDMNIFLVGSGAIGCEMLKNFAMMGVGCGKGLITVTDNDLIEKSNLNRQFLFRNSDIQKPKSVSAARAALAMNSAIHIDAHINKVDVASEETYSNEFFGKLDVVVNALDNVAARLYVDSRCVATERPLLESGTLGAKGHVQVILPHMTESYASQHDPPEKSVPFCTLKSFPNNIDHCIQWAREKFKMLFGDRPADINQFFTEADFIEKLELASSGAQMTTVRKSLKLLNNRPTKFEDCIVLARHKFQTYFYNSILQLVHTYPLDLRMKDGALFWASPKRPPSPVVFDPHDPLHLDWIAHTACLRAKIFKITDINLDREHIARVCEATPVPPFVFKRGKKIETDEKATGPTPVEVDEVEYQRLLASLRSTIESSKGSPLLQAEEFEKDDDSNHHIDFIHASANLRARNYAIQEGDRLNIKRIAGKIIPAIATTTSAVAGLVALELMKIAKLYQRNATAERIDYGKNQAQLPMFKNAFLNLALPIFALSEPAPAQRTPITKSFSYTLWDKWFVREGEDITLQQFMDHFQKKYQLKVSGVFAGVSMIYMSLYPSHAKRLSQKMKDLLKCDASVKTVDLVLTFVDEDGEGVNGPSVRLYL